MAKHQGPQYCHSLRDPRSTLMPLVDYTARHAQPESDYRDMYCHRTRLSSTAHACCIWCSIHTSFIPIHIIPVVYLSSTVTAKAISHKLIHVGDTTWRVQCPLVTCSMAASFVQQLAYDEKPSLPKKQKFAITALRLRVIIVPRHTMLFRPIACGRTPDPKKPQCGRKPVDQLPGKD